MTTSAIDRLENDIKQSDGEDPVMLELWWMRSISSLPLLSGLLWPGVVVPDMVFYMSQIELLDIELSIYAELNCLKWKCFII